MGLLERLRELESPSQFYGREEELGMFESYLGGDGRLLVVKGDPGMGKTTLTRQAITNYASDHRVVEFEMENANAMLPGSIFTGIVMNLLGNPGSYEEVRQGLRRWYGEEDEDHQTELLVSALHSYHNLSGYGGGDFSGRRQEEGLDDALVHFFSNGAYENPVTIQLSNYERRHLGENPRTDNTVTRIAEAVKDKPLRIILETRDDLTIGQRMDLGPVGLDHLSQNYSDVRGTAIGENVDRIRRITGDHPYANALYPHFESGIGSLNDGARLEEILDVAIRGISDTQRDVLRFIALSEGPISAENLVEANRELGWDLETDVRSLIDNRLVAVTKRDGETYLDVRNPRLGERTISSLNSDPDTLIEMHGIHYRISDNDNDRFVHAAAAGMDEETYDVTRSILDRVPLTDAAYLTETAVRVLDDANDVEYNVARAKKAVEMLYETGRKRLWLGEYAIPNVHSQIRLRRDRIIKADEDSERDADLLWREATFGFLPALAVMDYAAAAGYHGLFVRAAGLNDNYLPFATHLETHIFKDRACFDPNIDDNERKRLLDGVNRILTHQLSTDDNLGDTDKNHLAFSLAERALFYEDHNRGLLLERAAMLTDQTFDPEEVPWQLADSYDTRGLIKILRGDVEGAVEDLEESRRLSTIYGGSRKTRVEGLTAARIVAQQGDNRLGSVEEIDEQIARLIGESGSEVYFNFPHLIKTRSRLLGLE